MGYLHESKVGSHGHLTSTNCVIDSRWTCKVTDYGLCYLRRSHLSDPQHVAEDDRCRYSHMHSMLYSRIQSVSNTMALENWFHFMARLWLKDVYIYITFTFWGFYLCENAVLMWIWFCFGVLRLSVDGPGAVAYSSSEAPALRNKVWRHLCLRNCSAWNLLPAEAIRHLSRGYRCFWWASVQPNWLKTSMAPFRWHTRHHRSFCRAA